MDVAILRELQTEGRLTNVALSEQVHLSPSPCLRRTQRLERQGAIRGYRAVLDRQAVGLGLTVLVDIKVDRHSSENAENLTRALAEMPEVVSCYMVSGEADFVAEVVVRDLPAYEAFLTGHLLKLPMVADIRSNIALRVIKTDGPLHLP